MSHTLTETISFDPSLVVPDILDTDYPTTVPQGVQALGNRTQFLLDLINTTVHRVDSLSNESDIALTNAVYVLGANHDSQRRVDPGLQHQYSPLGDFTDTNSQIYFPHTGWYSIDMSMAVEWDPEGASSDVMGFDIFLGSTIVAQVYRTLPFDITSEVTTTSGSFSTTISWSVAFNVTSTTSKYLKIVLYDNTRGVNIGTPGSGSGYLTIRRLK